MFSAHPLFCRFENEIIIGEQTLEWTMRGRDFFFRPAGGELLFVWCELDRRDVPAAFDHPTQRERVQKRLAKNRDEQRTWRFWPLDEERELVLNLDFALLRHKDADFWLRLDYLAPAGIRNDDVLFESDLSSIEAALEPSQEMWAFVDAQMRDQEYPLSWVVCSRGDINELKRVLWACMTLFGLYLNSFGSGDLHFRSLLTAPYDASSSQWFQLRRVREILDQHFILHFNPLARRLYTREGKPQKRPSLYIHCPAPSSQHERLEALLIWRDFLRDKLPPEEIETLLTV